MKFASSEVGSKIRNVLIASVLYKSGLIDVFGTGFNRAFNLCRQSDVKYEYRNDEFGFTFVFYRNPNFLNDKINKIDDSLISEMNNNKFITIPELSNKIKKSEPTIYMHIKTLMKKGVIKRVGSRKSGY